MSSSDYDESIVRRLFEKEHWETNPLAADPSRHADLVKLLTHTLFSPDPENDWKRRYSYLEVIGAFTEILFNLTPYAPDYRAIVDGVAVSNQAAIIFLHLDKDQNYHPPQHLLMVCTYLSWLWQVMAAEEQAG